MKTVSVIDDDKDCGLYLTALLEGVFNVAYHQTWAKAKPALVTFPPDLILLDISMPEIKGEEVLRQIRETSKLAAIPVIALTAFAFPEDRDRFIQLGFDGYIAKPIMDSNELMRFLEQSSKKITPGLEQ